MLQRTCSLVAARIILCLFLGIVGSLPARAVAAQVQQGATLTVLRGQIALIRADGTVLQPARSGEAISVGDEIRTISKAGALVTFFSGTEIEMGEDTVLVVDQINKQGDKVDISLKQVFGATLNRVQTVAGSGSTYQIEAGGAVALVRGTTFSMVGPVTTESGNIVTIACREDCSALSTFAGCPMMPFSALGVVTSGGKVDSACMSFSIDRAEGLFNAATEAVTATAQHVQGDTRGVPAGQTPSGRRQEQEVQQQQRRQDDDQKDPPAVISTPVGPGPQPCNTTTVSGGAGVTTTIHQLGATSGTFVFDFEAFSVPDRFEVIYMGDTLLDTGPVSGGAALGLSYSGSSSLVTVIVTGPSGTAWNYALNCPVPST
jgi:hypothetical protein